MNRVPTRQDLAAMLPQQGAGAEVGVFCGDFAADLLRLANPKKLYLIDTWATALPKDRSSPRPTTGPEARAEVGSRFRDDIRTGRVVLLPGDSVDKLRGFGTNALDWVYIDTDHTYQTTWNELEESLRVVRPGGWISGHDYCDLTPGVIQAVNDFCHFRGQRVSLLTDETPSLIIDQVTAYPFNSFGIQVRK